MSRPNEDYGHGALMLAEELADSRYGRPFNTLPVSLRRAIYNDAELELSDSMSDQNDAAMTQFRENYA
jgi:hypothetical protein